MKKFLEKIREFRCSIGSRKPNPPRRDTRLRATARRTIEDFEDEQPTTKLSSAFIVVLILHIVAVGGIFAFKGIKAHRLSREVPVASGGVISSQPASPRPAATSVAASQAAPVQAEATPMVLAQKIYRAHGGETLAKVASQNGVTVAELAQHNGLKAADVLKPNQSVVIPSAKSAKTTTQATPNKPVVVANATTPAAPSQEAKRAAFLAANQQDSQYIKTTAPKTAATPAAKQSAKTYTVAKNDTVTSIARKHGVSAEALMKLNKIEDPKKLQLNQTLQIPPKKSD